jgi:hypothetical protein
MKNQFATLSDQDKNFIIKLCDEHGYEKAADLLYEQRPVGLCLITSRSALQRFYASHHPNTAETLQSAQYAQALQIRHQAADGAFIEGMLALVQNKILKSLKNDRPLTEMTADFRIFKTLHKAFLEEEERRRQNPRGLKTAYNAYLKEQACDPDCDFIRADLENDPGAEGIDPDKFGDSITDEEMDICMAKVRFEQEEARREAAMRAREAEALRQAGSNPDGQSETGSAPMTQPSTPTVGPVSAPGVCSPVGRVSAPGVGSPVGPVSAPGVCSPPSQSKPTLVDKTIILPPPAVGPVSAPGVCSPLSQSKPTLASKTIILPPPNVAAMFAEPIPNPAANPTSIPTATGNFPNFPLNTPVIPHFPVKTTALPTSPQGA